jgi:collagenase-like PrtC family protease
MPRDWKAKYTNMASMNRREWKVSNIEDVSDLKRIVEIAHEHGKRVYLTMNALYTEAQYPMVLENTEIALRFGVDALIVADIGYILKLKELGIDIELHISTGGTTFNRETVDFYRSLGAKRIIIPRHVTIEEALSMVKANGDIDFEMFILNRGCKNIDGFCTFHHGVNEVRKGFIWDVPKKANIDQKILDVLRRLPEGVAKPLAKSDLYGSVGACFLNYDVEIVALRELPSERKRIAKRNIKSNFTLLTGIDTCGACRLRELMEGGLTSVKIVGRENLTKKKIKDVRFLREVMDYLKSGREDGEEERIMEIYKEIYGFPCERRCYYPRLDR